MPSSFQLQIAKAEPETLGYRCVRIHPEVLLEHDIRPDDTLVIRIGDRLTAARAWRTPTDHDKEKALVDPYLLEAADFHVGEELSIRRSMSKPLFAVTLLAEKPVHGVDGDPFKIGHAKLDGKPVVQNESVPALNLDTGMGRVGFIPVVTEDREIGVVNPWTDLKFQYSEDENPIENPNRQSQLWETDYGHLLQ